MLSAHLSDVREQKRNTGVPTVRFTLPSPRPSPTAKTTRQSRCLSVQAGDGDGEDWVMERVRESRRNVVFRPRFDPEGVRRLCGEAMAELAG